MMQLVQASELAGTPLALGLTASQYFLAPFTAAQVKVGAVVASVDLLAGVSRVGATMAILAVVNDHGLEYGPWRLGVTESS
jgi:hypothetical protein